MENQKDAQDNRLRCEMPAEGCQHVFISAQSRERELGHYKEAPLCTGSICGTKFPKILSERQSEYSNTVKTFHTRVY